MIRAWGSARRFPEVPAANKNDPIEAAKPTQMVITYDLIYCIVSNIAIPAVTEPPGEFM